MYVKIRVLSSLPLRNYFFPIRVDLSGQDIREMLEKAIDGVYPNGTGYPGGMVQMSGIKVEFLISNYPGPKIQKIQTLCQYTNCEKDEDWCDLKDETIYKVALPR